MTAAGTVTAPAAVGVVTWNVQHAAPRRTDAQVDWLVGCTAADVVVLTEVAGGRSGAYLAERLARAGYCTHVPPSDRDYRVLLATRTGQLERVLALGVGQAAHRFVAAQVVLASGQHLTVAGVYVPSRGPREQRNVAKRAVQAEVAGRLPRLGERLGRGGPVVVAGDLNVVEPGHRPHHRVFGAWEYDFYRSFAAAGLVDAFRHLHPDAVEHSWFGRSGAGYRFDHLFCTDADTVRGCTYLQAPRTAGLSDHAALAAEIQLPPSS